MTKTVVTVVRLGCVLRARDPGVPSRVRPRVPRVRPRPRPGPGTPWVSWYPVPWLSQDYTITLNFK